VDMLKVFEIVFNESHHFQQKLVNLLAWKFKILPLNSLRITIDYVLNISLFKQAIDLFYEVIELNRHQFLLLIYMFELIIFLNLRLQGNFDVSF